ncbi:MarR family transcriptional regulator [Frigoribacterium sp. PhB160]|uniref:MarR family winged helix-turn-helix transcriptional regulator n=1 Tax=Frigoribacterium sp. PhB160 TaxID=2485192 RepID=UPI000F463B98|nr:MarR family transcriptional regulator [Frigoribacterium sp. PhB160]ROS59368.1 MarR family transcriptional regulator [Frigoribacterium sp. PhB160]
MSAPGAHGEVDPHDEVDRIVDAWTRERPDLDFAPLHVLSRVDRLAKHLERARRDAFVAGDVEQWEFDVLSALRRAGSPYRLSPKALLQQTLVSSGAMTNRIDRLVARGLVERRTDPNDGRGVLVQLTRDGGRVVDDAIERLVGAERELLGDLDDDDRRRLASLLRTLSLTLGG